MKCKISVIKILVLFAPFLFCIRVNAQALPDLSQNTITLIEGGNNSLLGNSFSNVDVVPFNYDPEQLSNVIINASQDPLLVGLQLNILNDSDYNVRQLTSEEIDNNKSIYDYLYDVNGNIVNWENVYFVHYDNGFVHGELYVDDSGNILTSDSANTKTMFQIGLGGSKLGVLDLANIYDSIANQLETKNYVYSFDSTVNPQSVYFSGGYTNQGRYTAGSILIPQGFVEGLIIPDPSWGTNGHFYIYSKTDEFFIINQFAKNGAGWDNYFLYTYNQTGWTFNGSTYHYRIESNGLNTAVWNNKISYTNFLNLQTSSLTRYSFEYHNISNSMPTVYNEYDFVAFKKLQFPDNIKPTTFDDSYDYDSIKQLEQELNDISSSPNELFDPDQNISESNYPLNYPYIEGEIDPSTIPFPTVNVNPSTNPFLSYDPLIQPTPEATVQSFWNFQIPFVENLFKKYPFSIPWDIKNFFLGFTSQAQAPAWDFDYTITVAGKDYTTHFEGDLSDYEPLAVIFRNLITISFIIFLAVYSYFKHS